MKKKKIKKKNLTKKITLSVVIPGGPVNLQPLPSILDGLVALPKH